MKDWRSPVAKQFSIQSLPQLIVYSPEGAEIKKGYDPALLNDPANASDGVGDSGSSPTSTLTTMIAIVAAVALGLLILTKVFGPQKRPPAST